MNGVRYGSDLIVDLLRAFGIEYLAGNPGATWRGLHESLENYRHDLGPTVIEVCHEEIGVALAHGYAKAAGRPMAVALHNVVGLAHATMAVFNAWCDRAPILMLGGTGPVDASRRRPWIDWIHTANVQAELVRPFIKWDDQPASHGAAVDSFAHAYRVATADPPGPVYLCYDVTLQEDVVRDDIALPDPARFAAPSPPAPDVDTLRTVAGWIIDARHPVILAEHLSTLPGAPRALEALSSLLAAPVLEVGRAGGSIRNTYELDLTGCASDVLPDADFVLAVGVRDLEDAMHTTDHGARATMPLWSGHGRLVDIGLRPLAGNGWLTDSGRPQPVDIAMTARPDVALRALLDACRVIVAERGETRRADRPDREQHRRRWADIRVAARKRWHEEAVRSQSKSPSRSRRSRSPCKTRSVDVPGSSAMATSEGGPGNYGRGMTPARTSARAGARGWATGSAQRWVRRWRRPPRVRWCSISKAMETCSTRRLRYGPPRITPSRC